MRRLIFLLALGLALAAGLPGQADEDQDAARRALQRGEIVPLGRVLDAARRDFAGRVVEVDLEREDGAWVYEIKLLGHRGAVIEAYYDARTATLLRARGRGMERMMERMERMAPMHGRD